MKRYEISFSGTDKRPVTVDASSLPFALKRWAACTPGVSTLDVHGCFSIFVRRVPMTAKPASIDKNTPDSPKA